MSLGLGELSDVSDDDLLSCVRYLPGVGRGGDERVWIDCRYFLKENFASICRVKA